jgi:hypothetical protein
MAPLRDPRLLALFAEALADWNCGGVINWAVRATQWVDTNLEGHTLKSVAELMSQHFQSGGEIDQVKEINEDYAENHEFHFDFRFAIDGRAIYIETLLDETRMGPTITIVSMHDA